MTIPGHRHERVAEEILHELGIMVAGELKDPRIEGLVTVTEVRVTPDLKHARGKMMGAAYPVILTEASLPDGSWLDVLDLAHRFTPNSEVIVTDPDADARDEPPQIQAEGIVLEGHHQRCGRVP